MTTLLSYKQVQYWNWPRVLLGIELIPSKGLSAREAKGMHLLMMLGDRLQAQKDRPPAMKVVRQRIWVLFLKVAKSKQ